MNVRDDELLRLAAWLAEHPANADGADKGFVVAGVRRLRRLAFMPRVLVGIGPDRSQDRVPTPEELAWPVVTQPIDDVLAVCRALEAEGVRYLIIGVFGIHLHAIRRGADAIPTEDCDLFVPRDTETVTAALRVLRELRFDMEAGGEPLVDPDDVIVSGLLRARAIVRARRGDALFDLVIGSTSLDFEQLWGQRKRYLVEGQIVHVAPLEALVRSKLAAGRTKDLLFLERFRELIEDLQALERQGRLERHGDGGPAGAPPKP